MKKINKNLEWYAFYQKFNGDELIFTNVLGKDFAEEILKRAKSKSKSSYIKIDSYEALKEAIKRHLIHRYWCKSEYEIIVSNWGGRDFEQKIDPWFQLEPNLDRITEYVMNELKLDFNKVGEEKC